MTPQELADLLASLTLVEASELAAALRARLDLRGGPDDDGGMVVLYGSPPWPREVEDPRRAVVLTEVGKFRELVIMAVRTALSVTMAAAKAAVDAAPCELARFDDFSDAYALANRLRAVGATVDVRKID